MTPAARLAASAELMSAILDSWKSEKRQAADQIINGYFKARRYIGSKDRGAVAELVYWVLRYKATIEWHLGIREELSEKFIEATPRLYIFAAALLRGDMVFGTLNVVCSGEKYAPGMLSEEEKKILQSIPAQGGDLPIWVKCNYPQWLHSYLKESLGDKLEPEMLAMLEQAPVDLRVNTLKISREHLLEQLNALGWNAEPAKLSPVGIRLKKREPIFASALFKQGLFEMQDEGSQMVALITKAEPGMKVIDFCAGAGGKTLAMATTMNNKGRIHAWDTSPKRLSQLKPRLARAGVDNVQIHTLENEHDAFIKRHKASADRVLVDAPCSGSGTWRRNPDLKWRFSEKDLREVIDVQQRILESASRLVKVGGRLIFATCSLLQIENERQIENFLQKNNKFRVVCAKKIWNNLPNVHEEVEYFFVTPHQDGVDGFFAAVLERTA